MFRYRFAPKYTSIEQFVWNVFVVICVYWSVRYKSKRIYNRTTSFTVYFLSDIFLCFFFHSIDEFQIGVFV